MNLKRKRLLQIGLFMLAFIIISLLVLFVAPKFINQSAANNMNQFVHKWWGISTLIQYLIYIGIAFVVFPKIVNKKQCQFTNYLETLNDHPEEWNELVLQREKQLSALRLEKAIRLQHPKYCWFVFAGLVVFDLLAGQLPFLLMNQGGLSL